MLRITKLLISFSIFILVIGLAMHNSVRHPFAQTAPNVCAAGFAVNSQLLNTGQSCTQLTTGPTGATGSTGATGATGSTGPAGTNGTNATSYLSGTTGTITGTLLAVGGQDSGSVTIAGATVGTPCIASTTDGTNPSSSVFIGCAVTAANTATVTLTAFVLGTPASKAYNVRVLP